MSEHRRGYLNRFGVQGEFKRDEQDSVHSTGLYTQADWFINEHWSAVAGLRVNRVAFQVEDAFITADNPDDGGRVSFGATNPVLGITRHLNPETNLYANIGRGFETPTFTEPAYRSLDGAASGPNLSLRSARSTHAEIGLKTRLAAGHRLDAALFHITTRDEIVVTASSGGRTPYTHAGKTRRSGLELSYAAQWTPEWRSLLALSTLKAEFAHAFTSSRGAPVVAGSRMPGIADRSLFGEVVWQPRGWGGFTGALELVHRGSMVVDDLNTDRTDAVTRFNLRLGWTQTLGAWTLRQTLRIDNLSDRACIGSVIVNDGNQRCFEPASGRQWGWA